MASSHIYRAEAHWTMHQRGIVEAESIPRTVNFATPPEFGGEPGLWTPERFLPRRSRPATSPLFVSDGSLETCASRIACFFRRNDRKAARRVPIHSDYHPSGRDHNSR